MEIHNCTALTGRFVFWDSKPNATAAPLRLGAKLALRTAPVGANFPSKKLSI
jgi:hypothetical protein